MAVSDVAASSVTPEELEYGIHKTGNPSRILTALQQILLRMDVLPWTKEASLPTTVE